MLLRVGLTGGITTGKSAVLSMLEARGCLGVDTDEIVHELMRPGSRIAASVTELFGPDVELPGGGVDRINLSRIVFNQPRLLKQLEAIIHPEVIRRLNERSREVETVLAGKGEDGIFVLDVALLFETMPELYLHRIVTTACPEETQICRLVSRDRITKEEAIQRIKSQMPSDRKAALADYVVDTAGTLEFTREQTRNVYASLLEDLQELRKGITLIPKAYLRHPPELS